MYYRKCYSFIPSEKVSLSRKTIVYKIFLLFLKEILLLKSLFLVSFFIIIIPKKSIHEMISFISKRDFLAEKLFAFIAKFVFIFFKVFLLKNNKK